MHVLDNEISAEFKTAIEANDPQAIDLAIRHQHPFHVLHVSTAAEIDLIAAGGDLITAEICPHHLFFNVDDYASLGSLVKMNPSIKTKSDNQKLWQALLDGVITVIATDHAPHTIEEKQQPYPECPSGLPAVENSLALMLNQVCHGKCTLEQVVKWMSAEPARVWQIENKGRNSIPTINLICIFLKTKLSIISEIKFPKLMQYKHL